MALQKQELSVAFGQGLDKKSDPKTVVPGKLLMLENAVFSEAHQIAKRYGYDSLTLATYSPYTGATGTLAAPKMVKAYNNEIVCADSGRLYAYSPALLAWVDKGPYQSVAAQQSNTTSSSGPLDQTFQSAALLGNYLLLTWAQQPSAFGGQAPFAAVIDITTGTKIYADTQMSASSTENPMPQACVLGSTSLAIFYITSAFHLVCRIFSFTGNAVTVAAEVTIATDPHLSSSTHYSSLYYPFDVVNTTTGATIAYYYASGLKAFTLDTTAAITHTLTLAAETPSCISLCNDGTNNWIYWSDDSGYYYAVYSSILAAVLTKTTITATGATVPVNIAPVTINSTTQNVYIAYDGFSLLQKTQIFSVTTAGVIATPAQPLVGLSIYAKPINLSGTVYALVELQGQYAEVDQPALYLLNMSVLIQTGTTYYGYPVAKALVGTAPLPGGSNNTSLGLHLTNIVSFSATKIGVHSGYLNQDILEGTAAGTVNTPIRSSTLVTFDFNHPDAYQGVITNGQLILNGGVVHVYDSNTVAELNFDNFPPTLSLTNIGAGSVPAGTYIYYAVYQWSDNQGNLHQSSPSAPASITLGGSSAITVSCFSPLLTSKLLGASGSVTIAVYRTAKGGSTAFQIGHTEVSHTGASVSVLTDNATDAQIASGLPLYINGNVLANDAPPPAMLLNTHNNRVWAVDSTAPDDLWYAKTGQAGVGVSFSGNLVETIDAKGGGIGAIAELDDKQILFKTSDKIAILYGDGANDTGAGSTLSSPQFVQTDVGCSISKSVLSQPSGLVFKSPKGWYQMDRSTQVSYIGFPVETYNSQDVTSAIRIKDKTLCVFLTSSGSALVYDYFFNQWSTFTNHTGYSADIFQSKYTYVRTDGSVYQQNTTNYLDGATTYLLRAQTSWLNLGKIQNLQRVKQVLALGDHLSPVSGHGLQISAAYDFISTFSTPVVYTFTGAGTDPFQYREHLARQKCDTVSLLIEEVSAAPGTSGEYIDLTDLGFEAGMKKGPNKLSAAKSVG